jgi:hypothetical protein
MTVITGVDALLRRINILQQQAPFATAKAMTKTVRQAKAAEDAHILATFDKPTPFTQRAIAFTPATKAKLQASVLVKDAQAKYLQAEVDGGRREFKSFEQQFADGGQTHVALPGRGAPLNQYGNLTKAKIKQIARDVNSSKKAHRFFAGKPKGHDLPAGIYTRTNNNQHITPLLVFASEAVYQKRFKFSEIAMDTITAQYEANLLAAWDEAVRTATR